MNEEEDAVKKVVNKIVDNTEKTIASSQNARKNFGKLVPALIERGIESINLSMFDDDTRTQLLNEVGDECLRKGKINEAIKAFMFVNNKEKLSTIGNNYEGIGLFGKAVDMYVLAEDKESLTRLGDKCLKDAKFPDSIKAFKSLNDRGRLLAVGEECMNREKWDSGHKRRY